MSLTATLPGGKAAALLHAALAGHVDANSREFAECVLARAAANGFRHRRALLNAVEKARQLSEEAVGALPDATFAFLLDDHGIAPREPGGADNASSTAESADAAHATDHKSFAELIDAAGAVMHAHEIRYDDLTIANVLMDFDAKGLLHEPVRGLASRIVAELWTRIHQFNSAMANVESIRTGSHPIQHDQKGGTSA